MSDLIKREDVLAKAHDIVIGEYRHRCVDPVEIMLLPTVEAIPVEWMKQYANDHGLYTTVIELMFAWQEQRKEA